jgi:hypothetical protein
MAVKRSVTKSKKDGVKKKTVTYKSKAGTVTRTKTKSKAGKGKTTTVSNKKGKVVGTASKTKSKASKTKSRATVKSKTVALGKGRTASTKGAKGRDYYGKDKDRTVTSGGSGDAYSNTYKSKFGRTGLGGKRKDTTRGTTKQVVMRGSSRTGMPKTSGGTKVAGMRTGTKIGRGPIKRRKTRSR